MKGITKDAKLLIVCGDPFVTELVSEAFGHRQGMRLTFTARIESAIHLDDADPQHVLLVHAGPHAESSADRMIERFLSRRRRPVFVVGGCPTADDVIAAMRAGAVDYIPAPIDEAHLVRAVDCALDADAEMRRRFKRDRRVRQLLRRVLADRRNLNQRVDLICRDVVGAYRRVFHRVIARQEPLTFDDR